MEQQILSLNQVVDLLQISKGTLLRYAAEKRIPSLRVGRTVLFNAQDLDTIRAVYKRALSNRGTKVNRARKQNNTEINDRLSRLEAKVDQLLALWGAQTN